MLAWARSKTFRVRAGSGGVDQYGDPIPGAAERVELPPCLFAPTGTDTPITAGVAATVTEPTAYWPHEWPDVKPGDVLEIDGDVWRVIGRPMSWPMGLAVRLSGVESTTGV